MYLKRLNMSLARSFDDFHPPEQAGIRISFTTVPPHTHAAAGYTEDRRV